MIVESADGRVVVEPNHKVCKSNKEDPQQLSCFVNMNALHKYLSNLEESTFPPTGLLVQVHARQLLKYIWTVSDLRRIAMLQVPCSTTHKVRKKEYRKYT